MTERSAADFLRQSTRARIGLGRSGDALPTRALLDFQHAHARARDAVHGALDNDRLAELLDPLETVRVRSQAGDRATFIRRPDLGRALAPESSAILRGLAGHHDWDVVFIVGDGLSAAAVMAHAAPLMAACHARLAGWKIGPVVLAEQARVALADGIGEALGARISVILIGERPGLSVADSLGMYLTWKPRLGRSDAERNCISNVHQNGLSYEVAADKAAWLIGEATRRRLTGVQLKEDAPSLAHASVPEPKMIGQPSGTANESE